MHNGKEPTGERRVGDPTVVACVVFQTRDPEQLVQLLREALAGIVDQVPVAPLASPTVALQTGFEDRWLKHPEAAQYLGISTSTLYRYAWLCGRLEYRRSILDRFKDLQIRPASRWPSSRSIIPSALGSGK